MTCAYSEATGGIGGGGGSSPRPPTFPGLAAVLDVCNYFTMLYVLSQVLYKFSLRMTANID